MVIIDANAASMLTASLFMHYLLGDEQSALWLYNFLMGYFPLINVDIYHVINDSFKVLN